MSRWGKPIKNRKHRDPRYFLNEALGATDRDRGQSGPIQADPGDEAIAQVTDDFSSMQVVRVVDFLNSPEGQDPKVRAALAGGAEDGAPADEVIQVNDEASPAVGKLGPTQNEISLMKSIGWGLSSIKTIENATSGDITGRGLKIVTSGKLVIDGHHRWSSTWAIAGPSAQISAVDIALPGGSALQKLATAQVAIAATMPPDSGKIPSASAKAVDDEGNPLESDNILNKDAKTIAQMIFAVEGEIAESKLPILGPEYLAEVVQSAAAQKHFGVTPDMDADQAKGTIVGVVAGNLSNLPPAQGPERDYMPQFGGGDTHKGQVNLGDVVATMKAGEVNYKSMYEGRDPWKDFWNRKK